MRWFVLVGLFCTSLCAQECSLSHVEGDPDGFVEGVDVISGIYTAHAVDLVVIAPDPLVVHRHYSSDRSLWSFFPHTRLAIGVDAPKKMRVIGNDQVYASTAFLGSDSGGFLRFVGWWAPDNPRDEDAWRVKPRKCGRGLTNTAQGWISGQTNPANLRLTFNQNRSCFELQMGDGTRRYFEMCEVVNDPIFAEEDVSYLSDGLENVQHCRLTEERLPSGNRVLYEYNTEGHLSSVQMEGGSTIRASLQLSYEPNRVVIESSAGNRLVYEHQDGRLQKVHGAGVPPVSFTYDGLSRLVKQVWPLGRQIETQYDSEGRVRSIALPRADTDGLIDAACFDYEEDWTRVEFPSRESRIYRWDRMARLSDIEVYGEDGQVYRRHRKFWGKGQRGFVHLMAKSVEDSRGRTLAYESYEYDVGGNVRERMLYGDLTGCDATLPLLDDKGAILNASEVDLSCHRYEYSDDGFNLLTMRSDDKGNRVRYAYQPATNRLTARFLLKREGEKSRRRAYYHYDDAGVCIRQSEDDGSQLKESDTTSQAWRQIIHWERNVQGLPIRQACCYFDHNSRQEHQLFAWEYDHDPVGRLVRRAKLNEMDEQGFEERWEYENDGLLKRYIDRDGKETLFGYDELGNCVSEIALGLGRAINRTLNCRDQVTHLSETRDGQTREWSYSYDKNGRHIESVDWRGASFSCEYDCFGRRIAITGPKVKGPDGVPVRPVWQYRYDCLDHCVEIIDPENQTTERVVTFRGDPTRIYFPNGLQELRRYDPEGTLHRHQRSNGLIDVFSYDHHGQPVGQEVFEPRLKGDAHSVAKLQWSNMDGGVPYVEFQGSRMEYSRGPSRRLHQEHFIEGCQCWKPLKWPTITLDYDDQNRIASRRIWLQEDQSDSRWERYGYDQWDRVTDISLEDHDGHELSSWQLAYDSDGRVTAISREHNQQRHILAQTEYSPWGQLVRYQGTLNDVSCSHDILRDPSGVICEQICCRQVDGSWTEHRYDLLGRLMWIGEHASSDRLLLGQSIAYDLRGNVVCREWSGTGEEPVAVNYSHGPGGRLIEIENPGGQCTRYAYNEWGKVSEVSFSDEARLAFDYSGDLVARISGEGIDHTFDYWDRRLRKATTREKVQVQRGYDYRGRLVEESIDIPDGPSWKSRYSYDHGNRLTHIWLPDDTAICYVYDALHCTEIQRLSSSGAVLYRHRYTEYDQYDQPSVEVLPGYVGNRWSQRSDGHQLTRVEIDSFQSSVQTVDPSGRALLQERSFDFEDSETLSYGYDDLGRLVETPTSKRSFDPYGHLSSLNGSPVTHGQQGEVLAAEGVEYQYDAAGMPVSRTSSEGAFEFRTNALRQVLAVVQPDGSEVQFVYDALGRKTARYLVGVDGKADPNSAEYYFYVGYHCIGICDRRGEFQALKIPHSDGRSTSDHSVAFELDQVPYAVCHDLQGNVAALIDLDEGEPIECYRYDPFGREEILDSYGDVLEASEVGNPWRFSEKRVEHSLGFVDYGWRFLDPAIGCWISPDPAGLLDGRNSYGFARGNPLRFRDVFGLAAEGDGETFEDRFFDETVLVERRCPCVIHRDCHRGGDLADLSLTAGLVLSRDFIDVHQGEQLAGDFLRGMLEADYAFFGSVPRPTLPGRHYFGRSIVQRLAPHLDIAIQHWDVLGEDERQLLIKRGLFHAGGFIVSSLMSVSAAGASLVPGGQLITAGTVAFKGALHASTRTVRSGIPVGGRASEIVAESSRAITPANQIKGWRVGEPVQNLTRQGNVPKWSTVRQRHWKNQAHYHPETYSGNIDRMKRGLAPQRINDVTGRIESMELHHAPPQREGGLFDFIEVWPDEHAAIDRFRMTGEG